MNILYIHVSLVITCSQHGVEMVDGEKAFPSVSMMTETNRLVT